MPPPELQPPMTPLAPSVEKAYYRKCIQLKRRLNEVEAANDEAKIRRVRLDRSIMKMRLERAFLLDELRKRMEHNLDGSEGSGDEGLASPPGDRPHRDKRRRQQPLQPAGPLPPQPGPSLTYQSNPFPLPPSVQRIPSQPEGAIPLAPGSGGVTMPANPTDRDGRYIYAPPQELAATQQQPERAVYQPPHPQHGSPYGAPVGMPGTADRQVNGTSRDSVNDREPEREAPVSREAGSAGEAVSAGPTIQEDANGDRKIISSTSAENANVEGEQGQASGGLGFTAVNQ